MGDRSITPAATFVSCRDPRLKVGICVVKNCVEPLPAPVAEPAGFIASPRRRATGGVTSTSYEPVSTTMVKGPLPSMRACTSIRLSKSVNGTVVEFEPLNDDVNAASTTAAIIA